MTEQLAITIAFIPIIIGVSILRISRNPGYLISGACLIGLSAVLILILSHSHKYLSLIPLGLVFLILFVKLYRNEWERRNRR
jgi:hypothetical protein